MAKTRNSARLPETIASSWTGQRKGNQIRTPRESRKLEMILSGMVGMNVMTVGNSEILVETLAGWKKSGLITEMPLAE